MGRLQSIDLLREQIAEVSALPEATARFAAQRIEDKLRRDATTRRVTFRALAQLVTFRSRSASKALESMSTDPIGS